MAKPTKPYVPMQPATPQKLRNPFEKKPSKEPVPLENEGARQLKPMELSIQRNWNGQGTIRRPTDMTGN